jgi:carbamoyltransferase
MRILGLKLTHDSAIALLDKDRLVFSIELEKVNNNNRFKIMEDITQVQTLLSQNGYDISDIGSFVIDGWVGDTQATITTRNQGNTITIAAAPYQESEQQQDIFDSFTGNGLSIGSHPLHYTSFRHVAGHLLGAYSTSPFAARGESAFLLVWDGGMFPRLYFFDAAQRQMHCLGPLFYFGVNMYSIFAQHYGPFRINENVIKDELSVAGKVMAYTAFGKKEPAIIADLHHVYQLLEAKARDPLFIPQFPYHFTETFRLYTQGKNYFDEDIITSFHYFVQELLLHHLREKTAASGYPPANFCFAGGAALNIKWNSAVRSSGLFNHIWICPFPNDSGSAIGTACCAYFAATGQYAIDWNVYSGPAIIVNEPAQGWNRRPCTIEALARLLHQTNEPVIFLEGKAELGPRALGHRSILANPQSPKMKHILNYIKYREPYRPIAPVCIEADAPGIFDPGSPDPYMLFDHQVRDSWKEKIPAVIHHDGTARLQTVSAHNNPVLHSLLQAFKQLTGIPVLCNTSANFKGCGFFADIHSATRWNKVNYVWCEGILYEKAEKISFL